jgi:hypothetical protein
MTDAGAMPASTDDDDPPPKKPPKHCPWCGELVVKRWTFSPVRSVHQSRKHNVRVAYVCLACKVAVRVHRYPERLCATKKSARNEIERAYDELAASGFRDVYSREMYRRGKCTCSFPRYGFPPEQEPCPIHRPLQGGR